MKCVICKTGDLYEGYTTVMLTRDATVVIVKEVPAALCENCGEYYLSEEVSRRLYARAEEAVKRRAEIEVIRYAA
ncbi:MAG: type II toxin-antitoxin system MqsA family antitoxin [Calditrichaeota bacterium]|nr:MAG: type II toxin-antitoxin system MqsA family antitoxin [Calditrichota bacterium]